MQSITAGQVPLHYAACWGRKVVDALVGAKADVDKKDKDGETPLHYAIWYQDTEAIRALLTAKADTLVCPDLSPHARANCCVPRW